MGGLIVQIYEIQEPSEAELMIDAGVDHIGSVLLSETSWKNTSIHDTIRLIESSESLSSLIPLFSTPDFVYRAIDWYQPDIIHFCESLSENGGVARNCGDLLRLQEGVKHRFPDVKIMRSIPIAPTESVPMVPTLNLAGMFEPVSDYFLTDTLLTDTLSGDGEQPVSGFVGITGTTCDWGMAGKLVEQSKIPVILAGGLSPDNVFDGAVNVTPAGVDSCTRTNSVDKNGKPVRFKKDLEKVQTFVREARRAEIHIRNYKIKEDK